MSTEQHEDDIRLKNKTRLAILRMQFIDGIKETDFYKECKEGLLEFMKEHPDEYKIGYVIYYDLDQNNVFYGPRLACEYNTIILGEIREQNFDMGYEIEDEEYY